MPTKTTTSLPSHTEKYAPHFQDLLPIALGKLRTGKLDAGDVTRLVGNNDGYGTYRECDSDLHVLSQGLRALPEKDRIALANEGLKYAASLVGYNLIQSNSRRGSSSITTNLDMKIGVLLDNGGDPNVLLEGFLKRDANSCVSSTTIHNGLSALFSRPDIAAKIRPELADGMLQLVKKVDEKTACELPIRYSFANFMRTISPFTPGTMEGEFKSDNARDAKYLKKFIPEFMAAGGQFRNKDGSIEPQLVNGIKTTSPLAMAQPDGTPYTHVVAFFQRTKTLGDHPVTALRALNPYYIKHLVKDIQASGVTFNEQDAQKKTILHHLLEGLVADYKSPDTSRYMYRSDTTDAIRSILGVKGINTGLKDENGVTVASLLGQVNGLEQERLQARYDKGRAALDKERAALEQSFALQRAAPQALSVAP